MISPHDNQQQPSQSSSSLVTSTSTSTSTGGTTNTAIVPDILLSLTKDHRYIKQFTFLMSKALCPYLPTAIYRNSSTDSTGQRCCDKGEGLYHSFSISIFHFDEPYFLKWFVVSVILLCVCGVYRTHIIQSTNDSSYRQCKFAEYEIFNDVYDVKTRKQQQLTKRNLHHKPASIVEADFGIKLTFKSNENENDGQGLVPSLEEIADYFRFIFNKAQMESDTIIFVWVQRMSCIVK